MAGCELAMSRMCLDNGGAGGLIVNTASMAGIVTGWSRAKYSYFAAKNAVVSLTRTLGVSFTILSTDILLKLLQSAAVYKETGVRVQCICPAFADTAIIKDQADSAAYRSYLEENFGILT